MDGAGTPGNAAAQPAAHADRGLHSAGAGLRFMTGYTRHTLPLLFFPEGGRMVVTVAAVPGFTLQDRKTHDAGRRHTIPGAAGCLSTLVGQLPAPCSQPVHADRGAGHAG